MTDICIRLYAEFLKQFPDGSMHVITLESITSAISGAIPAGSHPIRDWLVDELLEEVAAGSAEAIAKITAMRGGRGMSVEELRNAKRAAEENGAIGEELMNEFLSTGGLASIKSFQWTSQENAISPFDFKIEEAGVERFMDVKSTSGAFDNPIHMSLAEIRVACRGPQPYDLYRLYKVNKSKAILRIARDVGRFLSPVLSQLSQLPTEVTLDSVAFKPVFFSFEAPEYQINIQDDESHSELSE